MLLALPVLTLAVAAATGTLESAPKGWINIVTTYVLTLLVLLISADLLEEMAWTGFVQTKLMARHGLLRGALLTGVGVYLIHLPLSFEASGLYGTRWEDALLNWGLLMVALPAFRYLAGVLMIDTNGSVLAVGVLHTSFNASGALAVTPAGWQYVPAVVILTLLVAAHRALRGRGVDQPVNADGRHGCSGLRTTRTAALTRPLICEDDRHTICCDVCLPSDPGTHPVPR